MRIACPLCGPRDRREFTYYGSDDYLNRPAPGAAPEDWDAYLHLRDNPAGITHDLWYHESGCAQWLRIRRNTVTHEVLAVALVADAARGRSKFVYQDGDLREVSPPSSGPKKPGPRGRKPSGDRA